MKKMLKLNKKMYVPGLFPGGKTTQSMHFFLSRNSFQANKTSVKGNMYRSHV